jgi:DhnA family fructose-bisphosphate aldolase class Ia
MLIDKGVTEGEIISIKMASGEELIAKLVEDGATYYKLSRPMSLSMGPQGIGMIPFMLTANHDKDLKLQKSAVSAVEATDKQFADAYIQQTTGIKLA